MTLVFADSFDHYAAADAPLKGWLLSSSSIGAGGRWGTSGLTVPHSNARGVLALPAPLSTVIFGASFTGTTVNSANFFYLYSGVTLHMSMLINAAGFLQVYGPAGTLLATGTKQLFAGATYYLEVKATIHDSAGVFVVRVNGVVDINLSGIDTRNGTPTTVETISLGAAASFVWDDMYVCDTVDQSVAQPGSPPNNDFLGDIRVQAVLPNGNGNTSALDGSDGNATDNYLLVDETTHNGDTDYVESSDIGDKDTYAYGNLTPTTGTVYGVQIIAVAKKTDAGVRSIVTVARSGGTEEDGATHTLGASYEMARSIRGAKPGAAAWSITDVNAAEFGAKVTA